MTATIPQRHLDAARAFVRQLAVERLGVETYVRCRLAHAAQFLVDNPTNRFAYARMRAALADNAALEELLAEREKARRP